MVLLDADAFLTQLTRILEKSRDSGTIYVTMKRCARRDSIHPTMSPPITPNPHTSHTHTNSTHTRVATRHLNRRPGQTDALRALRQQGTHTPKRPSSPAVSLFPSFDHSPSSKPSLCVSDSHQVCYPWLIFCLSLLILCLCLASVRRWEGGQEPRRCQSVRVPLPRPCDRRQEEDLGDGGRKGAFLSPTHFPICHAPFFPIYHRHSLAKDHRRFMKSYGNILKISLDSLKKKERKRAEKKKAA